jgi:transposase
MEACGTSHHWARELTKLGHEVRLMPPIYVKPYVKRGKNDAVDAEAICEAVTRPTMRFVSMKSADQQAALSLHRTRNLLIKQRTQLVNMIRRGLENSASISRKVWSEPLVWRARLPRRKRRRMCRPWQCTFLAFFAIKCSTPTPVSR